MKYYKHIICLIFIVLILPGDLLAENSIATLRGDTKLNRQEEAPRMNQLSNKDIKQVRNYPEQPPIIPHTTEGYIIDIRSNKCLTCHARARIGESQAPMVSITHYIDREGQFRAFVTPQRYFCNQCHVPQHETKPLVKNTFIDVDTLLQNITTKEKK